MDKTLEQENKEVGANIPDRSLMAPLNVAPGITTDAYVHLQTEISAGSHATPDHHRLCRSASASACALCPLGYLQWRSQNFCGAWTQRNTKDFFGRVLTLGYFLS